MARPSAFSVSQILGFTSRRRQKMKSVLTIILVYVIVRNVIRHFWG